MAEPAIQVEGLGKRFGKTVALDNVSFTVPTGSICGVVGPNGAGKTTTIRILLDLLRADRGAVRVLGLDPRRQALQILSRVGYVPEKHHIYPWMRVAQVLEFAAGIYPHWDWGACRQVNTMLGLAEERQVKVLSRGELAKLAMLLALGHHPELLILDEPTSGLDPLVRRELLTAIVGLLKETNRTVFFSTHILSDIERIADRVIVMKQGQVIADNTLEALRARFTKISLLFATPPNGDLEIPGARRVDKGLREWVATFEGPAQDLVKRLRVTLQVDVVAQPMTLEDIFVELVGSPGSEA